MQSLRDCANQQLTWERLRHSKNVYELRSKNQVFATLCYQGSSANSILAEADNQQWIFQREGVTHANIMIYPGSTSQNITPPLALMKRNMRGDGQLIFTAGRTFNWSHTGWWRPTYSWTTREDGTLLSIKKSQQLFIEPSASDLPELTLLALFGFYLILVKKEDDATGAATSVVGYGAQG